jgi:hypothetical protein
MRPALPATAILIFLIMPPHPLHATGFARALD